MPERKYAAVRFDRAYNQLFQIFNSHKNQLTNLTKHAFGRQFIELMAASTDMWSNFAEMAFRNAFPETAVDLPSMLAGVRSLGYSARRPMPAKCGYALATKITGVHPTIKAIVPKGCVFNAPQGKCTALDDCVWLYRRLDDTASNGIFELVSGRAVLAQGEFKTITMHSTMAKNQVFTIPDAAFSDWFGHNDPKYKESADAWARRNYICTVTSDMGVSNANYGEQGVQDKIFWRISRRGFFNQMLVDEPNWELFDEINKTDNYTCILDTGNDGYPALMFSDGITAAIPYGTVTVSYFATDGDAGNKSGIRTEEIKADGDTIRITQEDGSESDIALGDLVFTLTTDSQGGLAMEDVNSMRRQAPQIYSSLDKLTNTASYVAYLQQTGLVAYANAYGEDVLARMDGLDSPSDLLAARRTAPDLKYSNIVRVSLLKTLYRQSDEGFYPASEDEYYLDGIKVPGLTYAWQYDFTQLPNTTQFEQYGRDLAEIQRTIEADIESGTLQVSMNGKALDAPNLMLNYFKGIDHAIPYIPDMVFSSNTTPYDFIVPNSELEGVMRPLDAKAHVTLGGGQHMYVHPRVSFFGMDIILTMVPANNGYTDIKTDAINRIYSWLRDNTKFAQPIYKSNIISILQSMTEVAGVNLTFKPLDNGWGDYDLDDAQWLDETSLNIVQQEGVTPMGFAARLKFSRAGTLLTGDVRTRDVVIDFEVGEQNTIRTAINNYYKEWIAYYSSDDERYYIREDLTTRDMDRFCAFIWNRALQEIYEPIFRLYQDAKNTGDASYAEDIYNALEAFKTWHFTADNELRFIDNQYIFGMTEDGGHSLYNYLTFAISYIKFVRNVLSSSINANMLDENGDLTEFSSPSDIVQFRVNPDDIKIL